jgi:hypothetical protein
MYVILLVIHGDIKGLTEGLWSHVSDMIWSSMNRRSRIVPLALLTLSTPCFHLGVQAKVYQSLEEFASSAEAQSRFDFVVVGGKYNFKSGPCFRHQVTVRLFAHNRFRRDGRLSCCEQTVRRRSESCVAS